jgi:glycosyltransferase involved in cell wall biosynthesis
VHVSRLGGYYQLEPYRHADAWVGNTRGLCDWMIRHGLPARRVHQIYNFAEAARPRPSAAIGALRERLGIADDALVLVCLGRLVPVKGHRGLLEAAARLPRRLDDRPWRLVLVGDGPLRAELTRAAARADLSSRLIWAGWQRDPGPFLQLADLLVFPSREEETFGNVILEAWAWRRPLVTTVFRGAREIVRHGEDAWCVPCDDPAALATAIGVVAADAGQRAAMVARGAERVVAEFGKAAIMGQYRALYRELVGY